MKINIQLPTEILHELFITVALVASQMKVAMSGLNMISKITQNSQQGHTICPTTERDEMKTFSCQKLLTTDEFRNFIQHRAPNP